LPSVCFQQNFLAVCFHWWPSRGCCSELTPLSSRHHLQPHAGGLESSGTKSTFAASKIAGRLEYHVILATLCGLRMETPPPRLASLIGRNSPRRPANAANPCNEPQLVNQGQSTTPCATSLAGHCLQFSHAICRSSCASAPEPSLSFVLASFRSTSAFPLHERRFLLFT
jgi:hypothetical protein